MARAKSTSGSKPPTKTNTINEQANVTTASSPAVPTPVVQTPVVKAPDLQEKVQEKAQEKVQAKAQAIAPAAAPATAKPEPKIAPEPRKKLEVVKTEPRRVVPINVEEEIRRRAYELYQQRGATPGHEREDWLAAEREVKQRYQQQQSA
ncbi:MAG: DUF2934 domain-containing protein [Candidatus Sulfotelmatobacter sp.]|jgi:hypothetical protein